MRKIELLFEFDKDIPEIFYTEPRRLKQIIVNLLGNSMKFTFEGYIKVICKAIKYKR